MPPATGVDSFDNIAVETETCNGSKAATVGTAQIQHTDAITLKSFDQRLRFFVEPVHRVEAGGAIRAPRTALVRADVPEGGDSSLFGVLVRFRRPFWSRLRQARKY